MFEKLQAGEKIHDAPRQPNTRLELSFDKISDCALRKWPHQHHICSHTLPSLPFLIVCYCSYTTIPISAQVPQYDGLPNVLNINYAGLKALNPY